jgi:xylulokinase
MLLTIDIGTSSFKSAIWNCEGCRLSFAATPLSIITDGVRHTVNPSIWLRAFEECCSRLMSNGNTESLKKIEAIIISGNGPSLVPVYGEPQTENGFCVPAENARLWLDRALSVNSAKHQAQITEIMGGFVDASFFLPKILGIKNDENKLYNKTKYFLGCPEYLAYALTGEARTVFPGEGFDRWFWNNTVLEKLALDADKFPPFIQPGDMFGTLSMRAAEIFGFTKNIPVISGGPDFFAAILGGGVIQPGQGCDRSGSSEGINVCTQNRINDKRLMSYGHPVKPFWNLSGIINTTGKAIEWCLNLLGLSNFEDFMLLAEKSIPGSGGLVFLPYLAGERAPIWNSSARGIWHGIGLNSVRSDFANSVLEGIGFAIRDVITVMEETGAQLDKLHVTGGLAGCRQLNQIKADITGREILTGEYNDAELLGLAIIGACSLGKFNSFGEAASVMVRIKRCFEPDRQNSVLYGEFFEKYKETQRFLIDKTM